MEVERWSKDELMANLSNPDVDQDNLRRQLEFLTDIRSSNANNSEKSHTTERNQPVAEYKQPKCLHNNLNGVGLYTYVDGVRKNTIGGVKEKHDHGVVSEIVSIYTDKYGPVPLCIYSNCNKTDAQLAVQAKKWKWTIETTQIS